MGYVKFERNNIISLYTKNDSEQRRFVSQVADPGLNLGGGQKYKKYKNWLNTV